MKNISPQLAARQNNCRNTSPAAIASQAGVDKGRPLCKAELGCCGSLYFTGPLETETPIVAAIGVFHSSPRRL